MKKKLRGQVKEHLEQYQLSEAQLQSLSAMQEKAELGQKRVETDLSPAEAASQEGLVRSDEPFVRLASIAMLMLAVFIGSQMFFDSPVEGEMSQAIAMEVAKNHVKLKPLEVKAQTLGPIKAYFTQLDFSPVNSALYARRDNTLLGGRYCSISGVTAAQLRYRDSQGQLQTLYEVGYDPLVYGPIPSVDEGEEPLVVMANGVKTTIWVEEGLLIVSAEN